MAYQFFTQPKGPDIQISLFGDAAKSGAAVGQAIPDTATSIIRGVTEGLQTGLKVQESIDQHRINEIRIQEAEQNRLLKEQQIKNETAIAEINTIKARTSALDEDTLRKTQKLEADTKLKQSEMLNIDTTNKKLISDTIASNDPQAQADLLKNQSVLGTLYRNPDTADQTVGMLKNNPLVDKEVLKTVEGVVGNIKLQQLEAQKNKVTNKAIEESRKAADSAYMALVGDASIPPSLKGKDADYLANNVIVARQGEYQLLPDGVTINPKAVKNPVSNTGVFQIFENKKLIDTTDKESAADTITKFQGLWTRAYGSSERDAKNQQAQAEEAQAKVDENTPKIRTFDDVKKDVAELGLSDMVTQQLERVKSLSTQEYTGDYAANRIRQNLGVSDIQREMRPGAAADQAIQAESAYLANETLNKFNAATPEERAAFRSWADANNVKLTESGLKKYYTDKALPLLKESADLGRQEGLDIRERSTQGVIAEEAAKVKELERFKNLSPDEALNLERQKENTSRVFNIPSSGGAGVGGGGGSAGVGALIGGQPINDTIRKVASHPLLQDKPAFVKAIASVESGGNIKAKSPTGVKGIMQVTGRTARPYESRYGLNNSVPEDQVIIAELYINDLIKQFKGYKELAYAAYNAGPAAVEYAKLLSGGSNDWNDVKQHMLPAIRKYKQEYKRKGMSEEDAINAKFREVYNYPDKVLAYESIYS